jgi:Holliday junction resolvase
MRRAARIDKNQPDIVAIFERYGFSVQRAQAMGSGFPDLILGYGGRNYLVEVKDGTAKPSERQLNDLQKAWHSEWRGQVCVIETVAQAIELAAKWRAEK